MSDISYLEGKSEYYCSNDGSILFDVYDPTTDEEIFINLPENFNELDKNEQQAIMSRRETLLCVLEKVSDSKRNRLNKIITQQSSIILVCPRCKKVFDSASIVMKEKTHSDENIIPYRKPKQHSVISDDKESFDEATSSTFDQSFGGARQIFFADDKEEEILEKQKRNTNNTLFKDRQTMKSLDKLPYAKHQLKQMAEKYGQDNVNITIHLGD